MRTCATSLSDEGVNAYAEPLVSLDLDLVVAVDQVDEAARLLESRFTVERFKHSLNIAAAGSSLRVQLQTDPRAGKSSESTCPLPAWKTCCKAKSGPRAIPRAVPPSVAKTFSTSSASSKIIPACANAFRPL